MSKYSFRAFGLVVGLVVVAVSAGDAGQTQPTEVDQSAAFRGEQTYRTYCSSCHGRNARGDGPLAKDLKVQPANLTELAKRHESTFPFEMVIETIEHGRSVRGHGTEDMPAWGDAFEMTSETEDEAHTKITELAHYLWSIQAE